MNKVFKKSKIRYITIDDIVDLIHKIKQRGVGFIISKLNFSGIYRTEKTFSHTNLQVLIGG